jgi:phosphatidylinositol glycan class V
MLYQLSWDVCDARPTASRSKFAFIAAFVHIITPAGLFLSAPYAESPFSFFNFTGFYLYNKSLKETLNSNKTRGNLLVLGAGLCFGIATLLRSNGLLSGLVFLFEIIRDISTVQHISDLTSKTYRMVSLIGGGSLMAACATVPQFLAYVRYCVDVDIPFRRQWCSRSIPSIYAWVQSYYW